MQPTPVDQIDQWHDEADVLVLGYGCAGAAAAIEARAAGADVLVLDRAGGPGGSSGQSGGELYLGGGTAVQRGCGFDDDADNMFAFLQLALGPYVDEAKLRLYCDGSVEHFEWFRSHGLEFVERLYDAPTWMPLTTDGLMWMGEKAWPYHESARPVPRGHRTKAKGFGGWNIMEKLVASARAAGVRDLVDTLAFGLVTDGGRVVGVRTRRYGEEFAYRARRAVIVTTGGFVDNDEMLTDHAPSLLGHDKMSDGLDDGSGILMSQAVGAGVRRMSAVEAALTALPALVCRGMLVNGLGRRFINEDVYPGLFSHAALETQPGPFWALIDEAGWEEIPEADRWGVLPTFAGETLAELEEEAGLPTGSLTAEVAHYNEYAAQGLDPQFHKSARWLRPLESPYCLVDTRKGFFGTPAEAGTGFSAFTLGGLHTNIDGEVLDLAGSPIPGLYAAGRASSGMHGYGYISGTSLGDGTFFGRRAGRAAAR